MGVVAAIRLAGTLPLGTRAAATQAGIWVGSTSDSENTLCAKREWNRRLVRMPQLMRSRACGISIRKCSVCLSGGECHPRCSGLRRGYGLVAKPALFLVRGACVVTPGSSIAGLEGFLPRDVTSTA